MTGYHVLPLINGTFDAHVKTVNCGTCPVTMACAVGQGGTGYEFECCRSTGVVDAEGRMLAIDCTRHQFETRRVLPLCPLCSGSIVDGALREVQHAFWVPTIYAKVPVGQRIEAWRRRLPVIQRILGEEAARKRLGAKIG